MFCLCLSSFPVLCCFNFFSDTGHQILTVNIRQHSKPCRSEKVLQTVHCVFCLLTVGMPHLSAECDPVVLCCRNNNRISQILIRFKCCVINLLKTDSNLLYTIRRYWICRCLFFKRAINFLTVYCSSRRNEHNLLNAAPNTCFKQIC